MLLAVAKIDMMIIATKYFTEWIEAEAYPLLKKPTWNNLSSTKEASFQYKGKD